MPLRATACSLVSSVLGFHKTIPACPACILVLCELHPTILAHLSHEVRLSLIVIWGETADRCPCAPPHAAW